MSELTHDDLIKLGTKWLRKQHSSGKDKLNFHHTGCGVILPEYVSSERSIPDVIGFNTSESIVIECKTSHNDYLADLKKPHRNLINPKQCGNYRYYLCPHDIISVNELTNGWGLLYTNGKAIFVIKSALWHGEPEIKVAEWFILYSLARSAEVLGLITQLRKHEYETCDKCGKNTVVRYHYKDKWLCSRCYNKERENDSQHSFIQELLNKENK